MSKLTDLSVIVPTWNNLAMLKLCVESVVKHSETSLQVVIHVNDGRDGTLSWVKRNGLDYTHAHNNIGICRALNAAYEKCRGEYIVYLNDDMYVLPGWDRLLHECVTAYGQSQPAYVSGTMVQEHPMAPAVVVGEYGVDLESFDERRLLRDFHGGRLGFDDWNGATWPPSCIHRKWWKMVGGYSEELSPGFYSDLDFSMKLWQIGCRRFHGVGASLAYHFGEKTTSQVRGLRSSNVKRARIQFLKKWGILPSTFSKFYLRAGQPFQIHTAEPHLRGNILERLRLAAIRSYHRVKLAA